MKGVLFLGNRSLKLEDFPDPSAGSREVVLEIKASGMCGSDLHIYRASGGETALGYHASSPVVAGHEPCGVVAEVGLGVSASEAKVGARVMVHHYSGCGLCAHCRTGWTQMCVEGSTVYGVSGNGGHARYMKVPRARWSRCPTVYRSRPARQSRAALERLTARCAAWVFQGGIRLRFSGRGRLVCRRRNSQLRWARASSPRI